MYRVRTGRSEPAERQNACGQTGKTAVNFSADVIITELVEARTGIFGCMFSILFFIIENAV